MSTVVKRTDAYLSLNICMLYKRSTRGYIVIRGQMAQNRFNSDLLFLCQHWLNEHTANPCQCKLTSITKIMIVSFLFSDNAPPNNTYLDSWPPDSHMMSILPPSLHYGGMENTCLSGPLAIKLQSISRQYFAVCQGSSARIYCSNWPRKSTIRQCRASSERSARSAATVAATVVKVATIAAGVQSALLFSPLNRANFLI